jgi:hypothetical protein
MKRLLLLISFSILCLFSFTQTNLADIAAAKDIYRLYGDIQLLDKLNGDCRRKISSPWL